MFDLPSDRKQRVVVLLEQAIAAIKDGRIEILEDIFTGPNSDGNGYTRHKETWFFGIEWRILNKPVPKQVLPPVPEVQSESASSLVSPKYDKMTSSLALRCKKDGVYHCPKPGCVFKTESETGLKKHYNRCGVGGEER